MKAHATKSVPAGGVFRDGGATVFIHKGSNGRWRDVLSEEQSRRYERMAAERLSPECLHWLTTRVYRRGFAGRFPFLDHAVAFWSQLRPHRQTAAVTPCETRRMHGDSTTIDLVACVDITRRESV